MAPWNTLMWSLMTDVCREMGVRTDVPFPRADGAGKGHRLPRPGGEKAHPLPAPKTPNQAGELDFTYFNAVYTVENALAKVKDEKGMKRVEKFLKEDVCPDCQRHAPVRSGARAAAAGHFAGRSLHDDALGAVSTGWQGVPDSLPEEMRPMAESICEAFTGSGAAAAWTWGSAT